MFVEMISQLKNIKSLIQPQMLVVDMTDCYTWSFPEFVPFCNQLYYFSNFKDFNRLPQA
jgi:hypothetical protein